MAELGAKAVKRFASTTTPLLRSSNTSLAWPSFKQRETNQFMLETISTMLNKGAVGLYSVLIQRDELNPEKILGKHDGCIS